MESKQPPKFGNCIPILQVVICTAYSDYSWDDMIAKVGQSDRLVILKKPFDTVEVLQLASTLTEKWRLLQETKRRMSELENLVVQRTKYLETANENLQTEVARRTRHEDCLSLQNEITSLLADSSAASGETVSRILPDYLPIDALGRWASLDSRIAKRM